MYDYGYTDMQTASSLLGGLLVITGGIFLISAILSVVMIISLWKIYKKAGKNGWESIIPIYNIIVLIQIVELPMWYIALFFVPFANIYAMFKIYIELAHKFGKSTGFGILTVFFSIICLPILAFDKNSIYNGNNTNIETPQYNPNNQMSFQNQFDNMNNNVNSNNMQQPFMFNQNINAEINQVQPAPNMENNNINNPQQQNTFANPTPVVEPQPMFNQQPINNNMQQPNLFQYNAKEELMNQQPQNLGTQQLFQQPNTQQPTNITPEVVGQPQQMIPNQNINNNQNM